MCVFETCKIATAIVFSPLSRFAHGLDTVARLKNYGALFCAPKRPNTHSLYLVLDVIKAEVTRSMDTGDINMV